MVLVPCRAVPYKSSPRRNSFAVGASFQPEVSLHFNLALIDLLMYQLIINVLLGIFGHRKIGM